MILQLDMLIILTEGGGPVLGKPSQEILELSHVSIKGKEFKTSINRCIFHTVSHTI